MSRQNPLLCRGKNWILFGATGLLLAACGGGSTSDAVGTQVALTSVASTSQTPRSADPAVFARSAALSSADLVAAEQRALAAEGSTSSLDDLQAGEIAAKSDYRSGAVARKALAVRIPAYRFFNSSTGAHFFTTNATERDSVVANLSPPFNLDGEAFSVASAFSPGLSPVHRFYNTQTGVHFYTISEAERANVIANLPQFNEEGVAYHASQVAGAGLIPFYRFFVPSKGFHFYTASESEKDDIVATLSALYTLEGIGYYVLASDWRAEKLPHTGITSDHCFASGNSFLTNCFYPFVTSFNAQQDGHRATTNPMTYSAVVGQPLASCVKDEITGLIWEVKTLNAPRAYGDVYTNLNNGLATDTSGYVSAVNASNLCGFSDWRLPTRQELLNIVDYERVTTPPMINTAAFRYSAGENYWSIDAVETTSYQAWYVSFFNGISDYETRSETYTVRLVRGSSPMGPRYTYSTVVYSGDVTNNAVNDAWTGLQWRRCEQGRLWNGSVCTGVSSTFTHEQALVHARAQTGWRLPNIKELNSLVDLSLRDNAIDSTSFPGTTSNQVWASSPSIGTPSQGWFVLFSDGWVSREDRESGFRVRLVRTSP